MERCGLFGPVALAVNPGNGDVYVSDTQDHRVLRFPSPFENPGSIEPDRVYGQLSFTEFRPNVGGVGPRSFRTPQGLKFDAEGNLWVPGRNESSALD